MPASRTDPNKLRLLVVRPLRDDMASVARRGSDDLITVKSERLTILDADRLVAVSGFNPNYLHLGNADARAAN